MTTAAAAEWDLQTLRRRLGTRAIGLDVNDALARWRAAGHDGSPDEFFAWLIAAQAEEQVVVTMVLPPRLAGARTPTVSADPTLLLEHHLPADPTVILPPVSQSDAAAATVSVPSGDATVVEPPRSTAADATVVLPPPAAESPAAARRDSPTHPDASSTAAHATRYVILGEAGKGGMAVVHIARDLELVRKVALKRLAGSAAAHEDVQARFLREVQISAQLDHPNIVPVYGLEVGPDGVPAYAMKFVQGQTLEAFLLETRGFFDRQEQPDEAHDLPARLEHFLKVCDAIAYAHDKGVVHRDLKPANVMIGRHNEIYVMDWGICRVMRLPDCDAAGIEGIDPATSDDADTRTRVGTVVGTARYMAPEQAQGQNDQIGPATDQYALGLMLYEIATLQAPYDGRTVVDVLAHAAKGEVRPVRHASAGGSVPAEVAAIIGRATALRPADRYQDVRAFSADIRRYLRGDAVEARPDTLWQKAQRFVARRRQLVLAGVAGLIAVLAIATAGLLYRHDRALVAAGLREREIDAAVSRVSASGDVLQTRLLELQAEIDAFSSAAAVALQHAPPAPGRFYWVDDFASPSRQPGDLIEVADGPPRSFTYGAWAPGAGGAGPRLEQQIRRLLHVRPLQNDLFRRARALAGAAANDATTPAGSGVESFVIGLAGGGAMHLPGHAGLAPEVDPRRQPWYELATGASDARWGVPYREPDSSRLLVPLAHAIRDGAGRELGVTAMLLSLDGIIDNVLGAPATDGIRATLLLDAEHRVVASDGLMRPLETSSGSVLLQRLPVPSLIDRLASETAGYVESEALGQHDILAFDTIQPLGWVLVQITPEDVIAARIAAR